MNALEQDFSGIGITSFSDVFLVEKFPRFVVSQVNANKSVDLIGRLKATNIFRATNTVPTSPTSESSCKIILCEWVNNTPRILFEKYYCSALIEIGRASCRERV